MQSLLQILKVNDQREQTAKASGNKFQTQDAECALLNSETGELEKVGVLRIPREMIGKVEPGVYMGSFALDASYKDRQINALLVGLQPYVIRKGAAPAPAAAKVSP